MPILRGRLYLYTFSFHILMEKYYWNVPYNRPYTDVLYMRFEREQEEYANVEMFFCHIDLRPSPLVCWKWKLNSIYGGYLQVLFSSKPSGITQLIGKIRIRLSFGSSFGKRINNNQYPK